MFICSSVKLYSRLKELNSSMGADTILSTSALLSPRVSASDSFLVFCELMRLEEEEEEQGVGTGDSGNDRLEKILISNYL